MLFCYFEEKDVENLIHMFYIPLATGHLGVDKNMGRMRSFYIPNMRDRINEVIQRCEVCQKGIFKKEPQSVTEHTPTCRPFEVISMDFVGPLGVTENGNLHVLNIVDHFSGWTESFASANQDAHAVLPILIAWMSKHGAPQVILSDRGTAFISEVVQQFLEIMDVDQRLSTPYHPQCNGRVENSNKTMKTNHQVTPPI